MFGSTTIYRKLFYLFKRKQFGTLSPNAGIVFPVRFDNTCYIHLLDKVVIQKGSWLFTQKIDDVSPLLSISKGCHLGYRNHIAAVRKVVLEEKVLTASNVLISDNFHEFEDVNTPIMDQPIGFKGEVNIGRGTWIGENACVLGAKVGKNCVVGANTVVTRDIPDYSVVVGVPARVIRKYDFEKKMWLSC